MEDRFTYGLNPEKLGAVSSYLCDPNTAPAEFLLVKSQYLAETGRAVSRGALFFQIRQAFLPGEVTAEEANRIGYETAMRWTKGKHQFFVCTHTDKAHIHNHIYFNATAFDRSRKFHNFIGSSFALRRLSDRVCIEHELSVIQNPRQHSKGRFLHYGQWIGEKPPSAKQRVRLANLFVQMGVRFISLAENVDSYKNPDSVSNIIVPITNVMNDNYCYQTSKKIRQVFDYKRRNGQYIGAFAPYGYVKHPKDKHRLIVDPDAAENVKLIFTMLIQGSSKRAIALYLNEHGVPSPSAYKVQKGLPVSTRGYDDPMWGVRMIHSILTNPTYTGDLAQGRSRVKSYKVHQIEAVPREEWVEVAGTHEAIIDYETFDKVQALLQRDTRTSPKGREVHLFSGFLKCADCGRAITRCVGKNNNVYYSCSTYKNRSRTACTMHSIKHERLEAAVLFAVQHQVHLAVSYSEIVTQINSAPIKKSQSYRLDDLIAAKERELTKITRYKQSLYQDWKDGEITQQEYRDMKADYERQTSDISAVLTRLNAERAELANGVDNEHPALVAFMKYQNIEALNREILVELVDYIKVYENGNISVKFKFADELRKIAEYIEINTTEDTAVAG